MNIGSVTTGSVSTAVWANIIRTLTADPATDAGAATLVWTHATRSLTVAGANVIGSTIQPIAGPTSINLTVNGNTSIISFSGAQGVLFGMLLTVTASLSANTLNGFIDIIADSVTSSLQIWNTGGGTTWWNNINSFGLTFSGAGGSVNNFINFQFAVQFTTSLTLQFRVNTSTLTVGTATLAAMWAHS